MGREAHVERHYPVAQPLEEHGGYGAVHPAAQGDGYGFVRVWAEMSRAGGG